MNLEQFYRENYRIVFGYLYSLCGDAHWAEDLTSETFLKAIIKIDSYDGSVKASTWLCGQRLARPIPVSLPDGSRSPSFSSNGGGQ